ncbi:MAG: hypothetical protein QOF91_3433 [Alphaproteobacteria bacterium]|nr:hypothetical protein [Alphaproteobacteria bacterium]
MNKLLEYLKHAADCRDMARTSLPAHRSQLEQMAETWEALADARKRQLEKKGTPKDKDQARFSAQSVDPGQALTRREDS